MISMNCEPICCLMLSSRPTQNLLGTKTGYSVSPMIRIGEVRSSTLIRKGLRPASTAWLRSKRRSMARSYRSTGRRRLAGARGNASALARRHRGFVPSAAFGLFAGARPLLGLACADGRDALLKRNLEALGRVRRVVELGNRHAGEAPSDRALDLAEIAFLVGRDECEGVARHLGAGRAANAVDVVLGHVLDVEVHDVGKGLDVDAARRDVRGDEDLELPVLEPGERLRALRLAAVAVDALARDAVSRELVREAVRAVLRAREGEDALEVAALEQREEQPELQVLRNGVDRLRDADGGQRLPLDVDGHGVLQQLFRKLRDRGRHRGREEERLAALGKVPEDAADIGQEAHVEHPVRLVEDEDFEAGQLRVAEAEMVEEAPGRRDDHVDAAPKRVLLGAHAHAAEDSRAGERRVDRERLEVLVDLRRQFARRGEDERARRAARLRDEAVEDGEDEGGGLAAARHRAGEEVLALHRGRNGVVLDGRGLREAHFLDAAEEVGMETERGERHERGIAFRGGPAHTHVRPVESPAGQGTMDRRWGHRTDAGGRFLKMRSTPGPVGFKAGTRERARQPKIRIARRARRVKREAFGAYRPRVSRTSTSGLDNSRRACPRREATAADARDPRGRTKRVGARGAERIASASAASVAFWSSSSRYQPGCAATADGKRTTRPGAPARASR